MNCRKNTRYPHGILRVSTGKGYPPDIHPCFPYTWYLCFLCRRAARNLNRSAVFSILELPKILFAYGGKLPHRKRKGCLWERQPFLISCLEGEVAALVAACNGVKRSRIRCRSSGCRSGSRHLRALRSRSDSTLLYAPCTDRGVPTTIELARLDVKRNRYHIINLAGVVLNTILSKDFKAYFTRVLLLRLQYVRLHLPRITRLAGATLLRQYLNDFSDYVHC